MRSLPTNLKSFSVLIATVTATLLTLSACGGGGDGGSAPAPRPPAPPVTVASVSVAAIGGEHATATEVASGTQVQFVASARKSDNTSQVVTATATWTSSDPNVLAFETPSHPGLAIAKKQGPVTVTATETGGTPGTLSYTVATPVARSLTISPAQVPDGVPVNRTGDFKATYVMSDKSTQDATNDVDWASSAGSVVAIGNQAGNKGKAVALSDGKGTISASKGALKSQGVEITVFTPTEPPQFVVEPTGTSQLPLGRTLQFRALLKYASDRVVDVTNDVAWTSSNEAVAKFPVDFSKGLLLANPTTPGSATVTAQDPATGATTAPVTVDVTAATIQSVTFTPAKTAGNPLAVGATRQLGVIATYSDNVSRDITKTVNWSTGGLGHLSVSNSSSSKGEVKANRETPAGTANDTVVITDPISTQTASLEIKTTVAAVGHVEISPAATQDTPLGRTIQFEATAVFADGSRTPVTSEVTWESSGPDNVVISNDAADKGKATALKLGESVISAAYVIDGQKKPAQNFVHVKVIGPVLETLTIKPADPITMAVGRSIRLKVDGNYSDGVARDVSGAVNYRSQNTSIATVATSGKQKGTVTAVAQGGPIAITVATPGGTHVATKPITVSGKTFDGLAILPSTQVTRPMGLTYTDYVANTVYSDGTGEVVTEQVQWVSSNPAVATVSNEAGSRGHVLPKSVGTTQITASAANNTSPPVTFRVDAAILQSIVVEPAGPHNPNVGESVFLKATGTFSDGSSEDITVPVTFESSNPRAAVVTNNAPNNGTVTAVGPGLADITASRDGITSTPSVQVVVPQSVMLRTVQEVANGCCNGAAVIMRGRVVSWSGGEDYTFGDSTGNISLEWEGTPPIPTDQDVYVQGVVESSGGEVDISNWSPATP